MKIGDGGGWGKKRGERREGKERGSEMGDYTCKDEMNLWFYCTWGTTWSLRGSKGGMGWVMG